MSVLRLLPLILMFGLSFPSLSQPAPGGKAPAKRRASHTQVIVQVRHIGAYRWVLRDFRDADADTEHETLIVWDREGRAVFQTAGYQIVLDSIGDITGMGIPDVLFHTWSGSMRGSDVYYIYALGRTPRCLLIYDKGEVDDDDTGSDFYRKDLSGDGRREIVSWYDGYTCWDCSVTGSARIPLFFAYRRGRFVDATRLYRRHLRAALRRTDARLSEKLADAGPLPLAGDGFSPVVQWYALDILLEGRRRAARRLLARLPRKDHAEFLRRRATIERVLAARSRRCLYPPAYTTADIPVILARRVKETYAVQ